MSGVKRYDVDYGYDPIGDCRCCPSMSEDRDGEYVTYKDYMTLLREYAEVRAELIASLQLVPQFITLEAARDFVRDKLQEVRDAKKKLS